MNSPRDSSVGLALKRILDIVLSGTALIVLWPLMLGIAWIIKQDSHGPVFFVQTRVGWHGKRFRMYKFRTMHAHAEAYAHSPTDSDDPRVTRRGAWLRMHGLDELPQLLNVLKGDMSLVGPRPEMSFIVERYTDQDRRRLGAKPGLIGLWQISDDRGRPIHDALHHDLYYVDNQSFLLDLKILSRSMLWLATSLQR